MEWNGGQNGMELQSKMGNSGKTYVTCKPKKLEAWEQGYQTLAYHLKLEVDSWE